MFVNNHKQLISVRNDLTDSAYFAEYRYTKCKDKYIAANTYTMDYKDWPTFQDLLNSMVKKNPDLSTIQKLHCLKVNLSGESAQLIASIPTSVSNFERPWTTLTTRCDNSAYC